VSREHTPAVVRQGVSPCFFVFCSNVVGQVFLNSYDIEDRVPVSVLTLAPARMEQRRRLKEEADYGPLRRGWCVGDPEFRQELISRAQERVGPSHESDRRHETQENKAERIVKEELKQIGWSRVDLASRAKGAPEKVAIAARLRKETTMTLQWIGLRPG
jgi:hypothetical protein